MKTKNWILSFLLVTFFTAFSQKNSGVKNDTVFNKKGNTLELIITNSNNKSKQIIRKKEDKLHGLQESFGANGLMLQKSAYKDGFLDGLFSTYNDDGTLKSEKPYIFSKFKNKSVVEGKVKAYQNKKLYSITNFKDDLKDGQTIVYYPNGKLAEQSNYKQNVLFGKQEVYYDNGQLKWIVFHEIIDNNGKPKSVKTGNQLYYNQNGKLLTNTNFKADKKHGIFKEYNQNTFLLASDVNYKDNKVHGKMNKYYDNGNLKSRAIYYVEIEVNGTILRNIFDGKREQFHENGQLDFAQNYILGKKDGTLEKFNPDGILVEKAFYQKDLLVDKYETFDPKGNKTQEINYSISTENEVLKSVKIGSEFKWRNNILIFKTFYVNGLKEGLSETFYDSGKISSSVEKSKGVQEGLRIDYYENGTVKSKSNYTNFYPKVGERYSEQIGWSYNFDEQGKLKHQRFQGLERENEIYALFTNGKNQNYQISKTLALAYFPDGEIMSFKIMNSSNQTIFANYFYQNKTIRKIVYQEPSLLNELELVFDNEGTFQHHFSNYSNYTDNQKQPYFLDENNKIVKGINKKMILDKIYTQEINPNWTASKLFSDTNKNGKYTLNYRSNKPFLEINFQDNLPHGKLLVLEPTKSDTLVYKNYNMGNQVGDFTEKFAGKIVMRKGFYHENGKMAENAQFLKNGIPYSKSFYNEEGKTTKSISYHDNGAVDKIENYAEKTFTAFNENGLKKEERIQIPEKKDWFVYKVFHKNTANLESESFFYKEERDSIYTRFFEDGTLQQRIFYKNNNRNGTFEEYTIEGTLKIKGQYVDDITDGIWEKREGDILKKSFYKDGKLQIIPTNKKCECNDTLIPSNKIRFVPMLKNMVVFEKLKNSIPPFIVPVDELNYESVFMSGLQTSSGTSSAFAAMKLLMFKPFAFYIPANKQLKITLNPCITEGYISSMDVTSNYSYDDNSRNIATIATKRISIELSNSPLESSDAAYAQFTSYFDVNAIHFDATKPFEISTINDENQCHTLGKIKDYLFVDVTKAIPRLFEQPFGYDNFYLSKQEKEDFFGIEIQQATVTFTLLEAENLVVIVANTDKIFGSGKYVFGTLTIPSTKIEADLFVLSDASKSTFSSQNLKKEFTKKGFTRLKIEYNNEKQQLEVAFFAEK